ncbi:alpha/beta hydrolase [Micromonospora sp. NPDC050417]|uniref:alpha/beta hydrolase n=1 Tax=Micromonospora sp. NPDC050417 TaxID=3364280 RepID=UPI00379AE994
MSTAIRASSILPARREKIELQTADGLRLVGELALPADRPPVATLICLHPLPTHGGMMDSHVLRKAAWRLPALADLAVLRFNTRGTSSVQGTSEGEFGNGITERFDVAAAIEYAEFADLPDIWLLGWSFGTDLTLKYGCEPGVTGAILLSPPLRFSNPEDLTVWDESGKPLTALVPEFDDYLRPDEARRRFAAIGQAEVVGVPGAKHLWVGDAETVLDEVVRRVNPAVPVPLPSTWDGPMTYGDASAYADRTVAAFGERPAGLGQAAQTPGVAD